LDYEKEISKIYPNRGSLGTENFLESKKSIQLIIEVLKHTFCAPEIEFDYSKMFL